MFGQIRSNQESKIKSDDGNWFFFVWINYKTITIIIFVGNVMHPIKKENPKIICPSGMDFLAKKNSHKLMSAAYDIHWFFMVRINFIFKKWKIVTFSFVC